MAETTIIDRRREIRRRKILENSEDRLKKLTGCQQTPCKDKINVRSGDREHDIPHSVLSEEAEVSATDNSLTPDSQTSMESARQTLHYVISQNVKENFIDDSSVEYSSCYQQQRYSKDIQTLPKILTEHRTYSRAKSEIRRPGQSASIIGDLIVRRKQWCVICGFLGRILLCLFTKTALSKCVVIFFLMMEAVIVSTEILSDVEQRQYPQGTVATVLLMYGVRRVSTIAWIYECFMNLLEDLLVFLFVFFLCHWWVG